MDITPPVITLNGSDELSIVLNTPYSDLGATATDNVDGLVPVDVDLSEVNTAVLGIYLVTYTAIDSSGNTSETTRTVNVTEADATAPVITLNGVDPVTITLGSSYTDAGATATDNVDGLVNVTTSGEVDTSTEGIYIITYEATDSSDNTSFSTRTVHVEVASELGNLLGRWHFDEDTGTVANDDSGNNTNLDLNNMSNANWITGQSGSALNFSGNSQDVSIGTASNALQTSSVTVLAWVNPNQNGLPWEWIAAQGDNYGLYLNPQSRSLLFYIKNAGSGWTSVESAANTIVFDQWQHVAGSFDAATQTLRLYVAGIEVGSVIINQDIGYTTGNGFTIGSMQNARFFDGRIDEVSVYDKALSEANINVLKGQGEVDITPPFITINGPDELNVILNSDYSDLSATATDNVDGVLIVDVDVPVDTAVPGTYQVTYTATDTAGNTSKAIRTVIVLDSDITAPVITLNGTDPVIVSVGDNYTDAGATATDDVDITVSVTIDTTNVDTSTAGAYTVIFTAEDTAGNTSITTRTVNVVTNALIDESVFVGTYDGADQPPEGRRGSIEFLDYVDPDDPGATADWLAESTGLVLTVSDDAGFTNALQAAEPGDRIQLESGVYQMQPIQISGSEGNPVTIESAPGQWAIFDGAVPGSSSLIDVRGAWLTFRSLEVRNGTAGSLFITQSHHHLYEGLKIHNNSRGFDFTDGSHHAMIRFNESYHNYDPSNNGQDGDGFGIWSEGEFNDPIGEGVILEHNISWANADDGIDMWMNEAIVTMRNNIVRNNGYNVLNDPNYVGNGNGFKLGPEGPGGSGKPGHYVIGNIADNNPGDGFDYNGGTVDHYMKGNAATNNGIDYDVPSTSVFEDNTKTGGVPA